MSIREQYSAITRTPFAVIGIRTSEEAVTSIDFLPAVTRDKAAENAVAAMAVQAVKDYVDGRTPSIDVPVKVSGTPYQQKVWAALRTIPSGAVVTYGELAQQLNSAPRAIGGACRANPVPLIVPCHRVVAAKGLGGFAGDQEGGWTAIKRWLLKHEGSLAA
jgi:methylated-DNA-[protein]-cysteine S-methyltransferase